MLTGVPSHRWADHVRPPTRLASVPLSFWASRPLRVIDRPAVPSPATLTAIVRVLVKPCQLNVPELIAWAPLPFSFLTLSPPLVAGATFKAAIGLSSFQVIPLAGLTAPNATVGLPPAS